MFIYLDECADEDGAEEKEKWKGNEGGKRRN